METALSRSDQLNRRLRRLVKFGRSLRVSNRHGIELIGRRKSSYEKLKWKEDVSSCIKEAEEYVLCAGRSFDEILPRNKELGIYSLLENKLRSRCHVIFVIANGFDKNAEFREECKLREGPVGSQELYGSARNTVRQLLEMADSLDAFDLLSIKITSKSPYFALFMTDKSAVIEHYLPYMNAGLGPYFRITHDGKYESEFSSMYVGYYTSFVNIRSQSDDVYDVIFRNYASRDDEYRKRYFPYLQWAEKLKQNEIMLGKDFKIH